MQTITTDPQNILWQAIGDATTQGELTMLILQIHLVCPLGSDIETRTILRATAKQIAIEQRDLEIIEQRMEFENKWRDN